MKRYKNFLQKGIILFFIFFLGIYKLVYSVDIKELEGKSEQELYNMMVNYYGQMNDKDVFIIGSYIIKNVNNRNKNVFYILIEVLIRNISAAPDKQTIYNEIVKYCDYIINNIDFYDGKAYYYKGWVYYQTGDYASAEYNLKKSIQNFPNFSPSLQLLLDIYLKKNDYEAAKKISDKILDKGYVNNEIAFLILKLYIDDDQLDKAQEFILKYSSYLNDEKSFYLISLLNYKLKKYDTALQYIEKSLEKYPDDKDYLKLKVKILYSLGKDNEAYKIIKESFKDTKDDEILIIKKDIESSNFRKIALSIIISSILLTLIIVGVFYYKAQKAKMIKVSIQDIKKNYQEKVYTKSENLEVLVSFIYEFFNENILKFDSRMVIYVTDPRKDNVLYNYFNNVSNEVPDVMYVFPKYKDWLNEYSNIPVHLMEIQSNSFFYEWIGGKNLINLKKNKLFFLLPLVSKGLVQGIIFIQAINEEEEQKIIQTLRNYKEIIMELAEEMANDMISVRFKEVAFIDELTRLYNRRFMYQKLEEELNKASRNNQKVSYILCDIDNFKKFNDTYGHQVGDEVLIAVAKVFRRASREFFDWPFRYGGEEIGIILPNTTADKAYEIAERIRTEVSSSRFENVPTIITISLGLATYPDHAKTIDELIKCADDALYFSKRNGKNRTTIFNEKIFQTLADSKTDQKSQTLTEQKNVNESLKLPSFVYNLDQFEEYYNSIKSNYKHVIATIEKNIEENTEKLIMEVYHNLLLIEAIGAKVESGKIIIKILLVERTEEDIQKFVSDISQKYGVKINVTTKV